MGKWAEEVQTVSVLLIITISGRWLDWPLARIILGRKASPLFPWFPFSVYPLPYLISFPYKKESRCWCLVVWAIQLKNPCILVHSPLHGTRCEFISHPPLTYMLLAKYLWSFLHYAFLLLFQMSVTRFPPSLIIYPNAHLSCKVCLTAEATELPKTSLAEI